MAAVGLQYPSAGQQGAPSVPAPSTLTALAPPQHKRTYQACIPCRRRKVRCDLGSVDNPHDPPCVRCRRESKECYFSATRRKRKPTDGEGSGDGEYEDEFEIRNGRKRLRSGSDGDTPPLVRHRQTSLTAEPKAQPTTYSPLASSFTQPPLTPGGSIGRPQPLRRPRSDPQSAEHSVSHSPQQAFATRVPRPNPYAVHGHPATASADNADDDQHLTNSTAAALIRTEVYSGHDALNLLFEAAGRSGDINHKRIGSHSTVHQSPATVTGTPGSAGAHGQGNGRTNGSDHLSQPRLMGPPRSLPGVTPVDPAIINGEMDSERPDTPGLQSALKAWAKFRFIRAGWFSAREAIAYIEYFYTYLAPLTPISPPNFHSPATHIALLTEEPILTVTLLTVSSRHMRLPGPSGLSRSYAIHEKLWTYLRGMIERMVWGQEQFGGGLRAAAMEDDGEAQTSSTAPWRGSRKGNLRTLGTVESLMLLTEWHPRALHFPPGDDGDELIVRDEIREHAAQENDGMENDTNKTKGIGGKRLESYLEPAWRSDRMCWMLLGNAMALSFELGVFDDIDDSFPSEVEQHRPEYGQESYRIRAKRVQTLLIIFVTQLAGRLEWNSNMVPQHISNSAFPKIPSPQQHHAGVKRSGNDTREDNHTSSRTAITPLLPNSPIDNAHACWMTIANIMKRGNEMMFRNKKHTRDIIRSGRYVELLNYFQPLLKEWRRSFDALEIPKHMRHILLIEAEYVRMYINSLALQAVVERLTNNTSQDHLNSTASASTGSMSPNSRSLSGNIHPSTLMSLYGNDQEFVKEVVEASRSILTTVVEGLLPDDYLKHCPIRTYFRIISGAMFLLKTFALGAKEDEVAISLGLMDNTVYALRNCVVDDVHLGIRFADLLETLTFRIRARFVRMAASGANNAPNGEESRSPAPPAMRRVSSHHQPPHVDQQHPHQWVPHQSYDMNAVNATNGFNHPMEGRMTPNPLVGISTESIDLTGGNISIMPPPSFGYTPGYENNGAAMHPSDGVYAQNMNDDAAAGYVPDWLALPLDPLLQYGAGVSQTEVGPDVGGYDLLEILLSEMEGSGGGPVGPATGM